MTKSVLLAVIHWTLVFLALNDLAARERVRGGRKRPWALVVLLFPYFGSLAYMLAGRRFEEAPVLNQETRKNLG